MRTGLEPNYTLLIYQRRLHGPLQRHLDIQTCNREHVGTMQCALTSCNSYVNASKMSNDEQLMLYQWNSMDASSTQRGCCSSHVALPKLGVGYCGVRVRPPKAHWSVDSKQM